MRKCVKNQEINKNINNIMNIKDIIKTEKDCNKANVFGIIIGIHKTKYNKEKDTFVKKIKILDDTFNYTQEINTHKIKFHKYILVSIYSKDDKILDKINKIGDIIWLRRFYFKLYPSGCYQANEVQFSNWFVFDRNSKTKLEPIINKHWQNNNIKKFDSSELDRVNILRSFSSHFFMKHSMLYIDWFQDYNSQYIDSILKEENLKLKTNRDLIGIILTNKNNKILIQDNYGKIFNIKNSKIKFKENDVFIFKYINVNLKISNFSIEFTDKSYIMNLPNNYYDYKYFTSNNENKEFNNLRFENGDMFYIRKELPFLKHFNALSHHFINKNKIKKMKIEYTLIKNNYQENDIKTLKNIVSYLKSPNKYKNKKFVIECELYSLAQGFENLNNIIKQYCIVCKNMITFNDTVKECCKKKMKISYNLIFNIKSFDIIQQVYMLSGNDNDYMFDTWRILPSLNDENEWEKIKKSDLELFKNKLIEFVNKTPIIKLVVEIVVINNTGILKIKDTLFLPY